MIEISEAQFSQLVSRAIDAIPKRYFEKLQNVAFVIEDQPTLQQREKLKLLCYQTLYGLYEGIPLTKRGANYNLVLPDKITIFRLPIAVASKSLEEAQSSVHHTVWHEVAHYFGLDHDRIHALESKPPQS
ncbi:metallopeptidase family protein [Candidatus Saccharibacteria bacterium]|nr:metallopeptidase family protein [Candidatus Saccharibacteria bacterium]